MDISLYGTYTICLQKAPKAIT